MIQKRKRQNSALQKIIGSLLLFPYTSPSWKLTLPYVKYIAKGNLLYGSRNSKQGLHIYLEGWNGEGDEKEIQKGGHMCIPMADSC